MQNAFATCFTLESIINSYVILNNKERERQILERLEERKCLLLISMIQHLIESIQRIFFLNLGLSKKKDKSIEWSVYLLITRCIFILSNLKIKGKSSPCKLIYLNREIEKIRKAKNFTNEIKRGLLSVYTILDACKKEIVGTEASKSYKPLIEFRHNPSLFASEYRGQKQ